MTTPAPNAAPKGIAASINIISECRPGPALGCIIPGSATRPPRLASAVCLAGSSASGKARAPFATRNNFKLSATFQYVESEHFCELETEF